MSKWRGKWRKIENEKQYKELEYIGRLSVFKIFAKKELDEYEDTINELKNTIERQELMIDKMKKTIINAAEVCKC